jgi:CheY-like chemotaxis protein
MQSDCHGGARGSRVRPLRLRAAWPTTLAIAASPNARHGRRWNAVHVAALGVLIVDDNWLFLEAARDRLEGEGLRVVGVAATSAEALRQAEELRPEVVLVDVMLGGESGFELARRLAARHRGGEPAVILISTYSAADFARPIAESPATGFLPKQKLSADAIRRIVDGREPEGRPAFPRAETHRPARPAAMGCRRPAWAWPSDRPEGGRAVLFRGWAGSAPRSFRRGPRPGL